MRISDWSSDVCSSDLRMSARKRTAPRRLDLSRHPGLGRDSNIKRYTDDRHTSRSPLDQSTQPTFRHGEASAWRRYSVQGPDPHGYRGILHFRRLDGKSVV